MSTKRLAFVGALATLALIVGVASSPNPQNSTTQTKRPRFHAVNRMVREDTSNATSESLNWSGYAATGSGFTKATGSWVVPTATCSSGDQYGSFWVGIDGYDSDTVEQIGTNTNCSGSTPVYQAWYEFCCIEPEIIIPSLTITPGDVIQAAVSYNGTEFTLTIKDVTSGKAYKKTGNISGAERASAEWIAEAPSSGGILPLTNFGTALFGKDSTGVAGTNAATLGGKTEPIGKFPTFYQITMVDNSGNTKAVPSALSTDLTSFSDQWVASE